MASLTARLSSLAVLSIAAAAFGCQMGDDSMMGSGMMGSGMMGSGAMDDGRTFSTNGETIFRAGRDLDRRIVQDLEKSQMKMVHSCESCHGQDGRGGMMMFGRRVPSIRFQDLVDPGQHAVPYTEELVKRFLDHETKSDGTLARTGVAWSMSDRDKEDLIAFLLTL